jgi:glucose-1-phosphate cytidylyltransferase
MNIADIPVFILCGGLGTRIKEEAKFRPKPMVSIGEYPILWHVMLIYARQGFRRFVLSLGFRTEVVKDYFTNLHLHNADCTIRLKTFIQWPSISGFSAKPILRFPKKS